MTNNRRVTISINNDVDLNFRKLASNKMLFQTGWYSKAIDFIFYDLGKIKIKLFGQEYLKDFLVNSGFKKIFEESL